MSDLKPNTYASIEDSFEEQIPTLSLQLLDGIFEKNCQKEVDTHINRASSAPLCPKRRWFQRNGFKGKSLAPRKIVNFGIGDISEYFVKALIEEHAVGPGKIFSGFDFGKKVGSFPMQGMNVGIYEQEELHSVVGGFQTISHADGFTQRTLDGKWELLEIKSAADWGYSEYKENGPGDYLKQAMVNLQTDKAKKLGVTEVRFVFVRKMTGHIWDSLHSFDPELFKKIEREFWVANQKEMPETPYQPIEEKFRGKPTGRKILGYPCNYCNQLDRCFKTTLEFKKDQFGNSKPIYIVNQ